MNHREHRGHRGDHDPLTEQIIGAAIEVHRHLGPGLFESTYELALCHELSLSGISFRRQVDVPVEYKGTRFDAGYRADLIVGDRVLVELKSVERLVPIHTAQVLTYLKLPGLRTGLLVNFNERTLANGVRRISL